MCLEMLRFYHHLEKSQSGSLFYNIRHLTVILSALAPKTWTQFFFFFFFDVPRDFRDLSSPTGDQTRAHSSESAES